MQEALMAKGLINSKWVGGLTKVLFLLPKLFYFLIMAIAVLAGIILAMVLSGDIDKDGYIKITRGVVIKFVAAVCASLFVGSLIIDVWHLQYLGIMSQGCIFFMTAVFGLLSIGVIYQSIQLMGGKSFGAVVVEVVGAFIAIFKKGV